MPVSKLKVEPNQALIDTLKGLLKDAESGELQAIAYVSDYTGSGVGYGWSIPDIRRGRMILGEMSIIQLDLASHISVQYGIGTIASLDRRLSCGGL